MKSAFIIALLLCMAFLPKESHAQACEDFAKSGCAIVVAPQKSFVKKTSSPITRVAIAGPDVADVELLTPHQVMIIAKAREGRTSLVLWHGDEDAQVYDVMVRIPDDQWSAIQHSINQLVPEADVKVLRLGSTILLDGTVPSVRGLERVLDITRSYASEESIKNAITVEGSQQVQLEVKLAEVSRSGLKQLGLGFLLDKKWKIGMFPSGTATGQLDANRTETTTAPPSSTLTSIGDTAVLLQDPAAQTRTSNSLSSAALLTSPFGSAFQVLAHGLDDDVLALVSLLKGQGVSRLLAQPTLVAMNGQEAEFLVGGEFPFPVTGEDGTTNIEFKDFGIMLRFTPYVVGEETITLAVEPEVSSLDFSLLTVSGGAAVPGLTTRRGKTKLQLKDGQTFVMAGLLREETRMTVNKIPFLGDIPVLGTLFTSKEFQKSETELVVIVTPRIVRALNPEEVGPLPGAELGGEVSDLDFFVSNRLWGKTDAPTATETKAPRFSGEIGFVR